jgi:alpha-glucosidase
VLSLTTAGSAPARPVLEGFISPDLRFGELLSIFVSGLSVSGTTVASAPFPTELENISVEVNGIPSLVFSVSPTVVSFILPEGIQAGEDAIVRLFDGAAYSAGHQRFVRDPATVSVGNVVTTTIGADTVDFALDGGAVARVSLVDSNIARVRLNPNGVFTTRLTGAIATSGLGSPSTVISEAPTYVVLETSALRLIVNKTPFGVRAERPDGTLIVEDAEPAVEWNGATGVITSVKTTEPGQPYFGLGLRGGPLNRRGDTFKMRNTDQCCYGEFDGPLYVSVPFYYSERNGRFFGVFHDNAAEASFDMDSRNRGEITYRAQRGELDYYLCAGPAPRDVVREFSRLTGYSPLPPLWSLGYQQSRYGYQSSAEILNLANTFRSLDIPADGLWLDLDWMNGLNFLDWDPVRFPDPVGMGDDLQALGFHYVNIVDLAVQPDDPLTPFLTANDLFLEDAAGNPVPETLFAPFNDIFWLDITNPATASWYTSNLETFLTTYHPGGIWNDLNEIASNNLPTAVYDFGGDPRPDIEARNIFALRELTETREAWAQAWPEERPFLLSRSGYPGIQRYAANWSGDTLSSFDSMRVSVQTSIHMGMSGNNVFGHDIGGFIGSPSPELFIRWLAFGGYTTFFRNHALDTTAAKEPWAFGEPYTTMAREIINQRYRILPYLYSLHELAAREADPVLAATFFHFPEDVATYQQDTEYMLGPSLLVAPVFTAGATERTLYLPAGTDWYDLETDQKYAGGQEITVPAPLDHIPVFVRAGSMLPLASVRQHVQETTGDDRIALHLYPGSFESPALYEDDGISNEHESGEYLRTSVQETASSFRRDFLFVREGSYQPAPRSTWLELHDFQADPVAAVIDGRVFARERTVAALDSVEAGWYFDGATRRLTVRAGAMVQTVSIVLNQPPAKGSVPHLFYFDLDGDLQGDPNNAVILPSAERIPGLVLWGNDPDDSSAAVTTPLVDRGPRLIGYDLLSSPQNGSLKAEVLRDMGVEVGAVKLQWAQIETGGGVFDGPQNGTLGLLNALLASRNWQLDLTVGPVGDTSLSLPTDLVGSGLTAASLPARFNALLDHLHASLPGIPLHNLRLGQNVDLYFATETDPLVRAAYLSWLQSAVAHAKSLWGSGLQVSLTMTAEGIRAAEPGGYLQSLLAEVDVVAVSYQPLLDEHGLAAVPWEIGSLFDRLAAAFPGKPIHLVDIAFSASRVIGSSPTRQVQFIGELLRAWDRHLFQMPYISFAPIVDRSAAAAEAEALLPRYGATGGDLAALEVLLSSQGIRTFSGDSSPKPAFSTLRNGLFDRGWWLVPPRASRSFLLGLSAEPYDLEPGNLDPSKPFIDSVMDELFALLDVHADLVMFNFDNGVPWVEAETDELLSAELPYSENVKATWDGLRRRANPGQFTAVSIGPLGTPRGRPAAYWGAGEGYYLDLNNERVPNGIMQDYLRRLPPGVWASRDLDSPALRQAFVNYAKRTIDYFQPEYLIVGLETNETLDEGQAFANKYIAFQKFVYESLKADPAYAGTKLVVSISGEFLMLDELGYGHLQRVKENPILYEAHRDFVQALLPYTDVLGLSLHPSKLRLPAESLPVAAYTRLFAELRSLTTKPFAITETDFPAASFSIFGTDYYGSLTKQERYMRMLLEEVERDGNFEFVLNYAIKDLTPQLDRMRLRAQEDPPFISPVLVEFFKIFEFTGLYDDDGTPRPAVDTWINRFLLPFAGSPSLGSPVRVESPDGTLQAEFSINTAGRLVYRVLQNGSEVLLPSPLGVTVDGVDLGSSALNVSLKSLVEINETYPLLAARSTATNHCHEATLAVRRTGDLEFSFELQVRVYDDGVAYRYVIPAPRLGDPHAPRTLSGEASGWVVPDGSIVWHQDQTENYEADFRSLEVGYFDIDVGGQLTVELPGSPPAGYLFISEAAMRNYSGMTLRGQFLSGLLQATFLDDTTWQMDPGQWSPWRFTMVGETLADLVASDLVPNLNEAPDPVLFPNGSNAPWIKPGRALWSWWIDSNSGANFEVQKHYIDEADAMGLEFVTIDIYWELGFPSGGKDQFERLADLVTYAKSDGRDIELWVWKNWYEILDPFARQEFLQKVKAAGAVGVKVDPVFGQASESQLSVGLHEAILREAAAQELMVNFHGTHKAHGLFRTYPNAITHEGFRGLEDTTLIYQTNPGGLVPPEHNATLVFTRFLAGPGDYTPVTFDPLKIGKTTFTHQLSLAGLMTSPLVHFADSPEILQGQTDVLDLLTAIPTVWDETIAVGPNKIGDFAMLARRHGQEWWLFGINGDSVNPKSITDLDLSFLGGGFFQVSRVADDTAVTFDRDDELVVFGGSTIDFDLLPGGGYVARFLPAAALDYPTWALATMPDDPALRDSLLDPDDDGLPNILEMALGGNPLVADQGLLPTATVVKDGGTDYLEYSFRHRADPYGEAIGIPGVEFTLGGLFYRVEVSGDLTVWSSAAGVAAAQGVPLANGDGTVTVRIRIPLAALPMGDQQFIRLHVSLAP